MRWTLIALVAAALVAFGLVALRDQHGPPSSDSSRSPADPDVSGTTGDRKSEAVKPNRLPEPTVPDAPLPPLDAPLSAVLTDLRDRAASGERAAACRLALEVAECRTALTMRPSAMENMLAERAASLEESQRAALTDRVIETIAERREFRERCDGISTDLVRELPRFYLRAAQLGDRNAALRFLTAEGVTPADFVTDPSLVQLYQGSSWPVFVSLLEAGDRRAALLLLNATAPDTASPLSAVLPQEWRDPAVAQELAVLLGVAPPVPGADRTPEASQRARTLAERYFSGTAGASGRILERPDRGACDDLDGS